MDEFILLRQCSSKSDFHHITASYFPYGGKSPLTVSISKRHTLYIKDWFWVEWLVHCTRSMVYYSYTYCDGKKLRKFKTEVGNHKIKYIFRYLILITNDSHQCYSTILHCLVSGICEMNQGVRRKSSDAAQSLVCPPFTTKTARQRCLMLQISFLMTCNGIVTHSACKAHSKSRILLTLCALSPDDLSCPISAQWERDLVILQATAKH